MLSIKNITTYYGQKKVLSDLSLAFSDRRTCIVGPNGIGKTTLLFVLAGLIKPNLGEVLWRDEIVVKPQSKTAVASDAISIPGFLTVEKLLRLTKELWQVKIPRQLIHDFGLEPHMGRKIAHLSAGNLKKAQLINTFMRKPEVLLLDEPNIALDEKSCEVLFKAIKEYPGSIIVASNEPKRFADKGFQLRGLSHH